MEPDPARFSRKWFGDVALVTWGVVCIVGLFRRVLDWDDGWLHYAVVGPLMAALVISALAWLALAVRDVNRYRREQESLRPWAYLIGCAAGAVVAAFVLAVILAGG